MVPEVSGSQARAVRGDLLNWARLQQDLTMRWVRDHGGPSPGYQCEVEQGQKSEVRSDLLAAWTRALGVTESFARGQIPAYHDHPAACRGLAGHVVSRVSHAEAGAWKKLSPMERARKVLQLITLEPTPLPKVVLAYVVGLSLESLTAALAGQMPIGPQLKQAIKDLTTLSDGFFSHGELESVEDQELVGRYLPALRLAQRAGITPEELEALAARKLSS